MTTKDEIDVYDKAKVSVDTGEIEEFDKIIFSRAKNSLQSSNQ